MPSIIPNFEYDIFISYRQRDNRGDHWVTEFVSALKTELEGTFKEDVSIYFDTNPHDGLLETHNVDKSLEAKLKCLIFIPIISQTYCDTKSFAWQHELCAFNKRAKEDKFGRDIKLGTGNVASRILPIKIHDLDSEDKALLENELGGVLRAIEFIFKSAGVNRPLLAQEEHPQDNVNKTFYRDQVNKVANGIKEIINSIRNSGTQTTRTNTDYQSKTKKQRSKKTLIAIVVSLFVLLSVVSYIIYSKVFLPVREEESPDKSIAILPFVDMSPGKDQEYFSDGTMLEILNNLFKIGGLKVTSRTTVMGYKGTTKSIGEIGRELHVANILEGVVRKSGSRVIITVQLIDPVTDEPRWAENYDREMTDVFAIQSEVAQKIASFLKTEISQEVKKRMEVPLTRNTEALDLYLKAKSILWEEPMKAEALLHKVILLDSNFAPAYADLGAVWINRGSFKGDLNAKEVVENATPFLNKALALNSNYPDTHIYLAGLKIFFEWDFEGAQREMSIARRLNPSEVYPRQALILLSNGNFQEALAISKIGYSIDPSAFRVQLGFSHFFMNQREEAMKVCQEVGNYSGDVFGVTKLFLFMELYDDVIRVSEEWLRSNPTSRLPVALGNLAIASYHTNKKSRIENLLKELKQKSEKSPVGSPAYFTAMVYAQMGETELAFEWLEKAYRDHEVEMFWLKIEPPFEPLRKDPRWQVMLDKVGFPK